MADGPRPESFQAMDDSFHELEENSLLCTECGKKFKTRGGLRKHTITKHDNNNNLKHECNVCNRTFLEKHQLVSHMIRHGNEKFKCSIEDCGKEYYSKASLRLHVVHFHEKKSYSRSSCSMVYSDMHVLKDHVVAVHSHGFAHRCRTCGKAFKWRVSLAKHIKKRH